MKRLNRMMISMTLFLIAALIGVSMLFYYVSAVTIYERDQHNKLIKLAETLHNVQRCSWVSGVIIKEKIITLRCDNPFNGNRYYFFTSKVLRLDDLDPTEVHLETAKTAFAASSGIMDLQITLTYYEEKPVYWITSEHTEWLIDIKSNEILWKVDKQYD